MERQLQDVELIICYKTKSNNSINNNMIIIFY